MTRDEIEQAIDQLYRCPLGEFVPARNELAARLRKGANKETAAEVKALVKPSFSAWAVNRLFWQRRPVYDELVAAGERFRAVQHDALRGRTDTGLESAAGDRGASVQTALKEVLSLLEGVQQKTTPALIHRISMTLEAIAAYGQKPDEPMRGRMTRDLQPPGFGAFASLASDEATVRPPVFPPASPSESPGPETESLRDEKDRARARLELSKQEAERRIQERDRLQTRLDEALRELASAQRAVEEALRTLTDSRARAEIATSAVSEMRSQVVRATSACEGAREEVALAERELARLG